MPARCDKHKVSLRRKWLGGKPTLQCPYSHTRINRDPFPRTPCRKCGKPGVYSEGLCYPCHYYRPS